MDLIIKFLFVPSSTRTWLSQTDCVSAVHSVRRGHI